MFWIGILPAKVIVQEVTVQDYKARNKIKMVFEELNFINLTKSSSIKEKEFKENLAKSMTKSKKERNVK